MRSMAAVLALLWIAWASCQVEAAGVSGMKLATIVTSAGGKPLHWRGADAPSCLTASGLSKLASLYTENTDSSLSAAAAQAYLWGAPLIHLAKRMAETEQSDGNKVSVLNANQWYHDSSKVKVTAKATPSVSHVTSRAFLDLSAGPMVLTVPTQSGSYFSLTVTSFSAQRLATLDNTTTTTKWLLVGPAFKGALPSPFKESNTISSPTQAVVLTLQLVTPSWPQVDSKALAALQAKFSVAPLAGTPSIKLATSAATAIQSLQLGSPANAWTQFKAISDMLWVRSPSFNSADASLFAQVFSSIGLTPSGLAASLTPAQKTAMNVGFALATTCINTYNQLRRVKPSSPWTVPTTDIPGAAASPLKASLQGAVKASLFGSALSPDAGVTVFVYRPRGTMPGYLDYTVSVPRQTSPWSLTVYNADTGVLALAHNPQFRLLTHNTSGLTFKANTLSVTVSAKPPSNKAALSNWLPVARNTPVQLVLRVYGTAAKPVASLNVKESALPPVNATSRRSLLQTQTTLPTTTVVSMAQAALSLGYNSFMGLPLVGSAMGESIDAGIMPFQVFSLASNAVTVNSAPSCVSSYSSQSSYSSADNQHQASFGLDFGLGKAGPVSFSMNADFSKSEDTCYSQNQLSVTTYMFCSVGAAQLSSNAYSGGLTPTPQFNAAAQALLSAYNPSYACPFTESTPPTGYPAGCTCTFYAFGCSISCNCAGASGTLTLNAGTGFSAGCTATSAIAYSNNQLFCVAGSGGQATSCPYASAQAMQSSSTSCFSSSGVQLVPGNWSSLCQNPICNFASCVLSVWCTNANGFQVATNFDLSKCPPGYNTVGVVSGSLQCTPSTNFNARMEVFINTFGTGAITATNFGGVANSFYHMAQMSYTSTVTSGQSVGVTASLSNADLLFGDSPVSVDDESVNPSIPVGSSVLTSDDLVQNNIQYGATVAPYVSIPLTDATACASGQLTSCLINTAQYTQNLVNLVSSQSEGSLPQVQYQVANYGTLFQSYGYLFPGVPSTVLSQLGQAMDNAVSSCQSNGWCLPIPSSCATGSYSTGNNYYPFCQACNTVSGPNCYMPNTVSCTATYCTCTEPWWTSAPGFQGCSIINQGTCAATSSKKLVWNDCTAPFSSTYTEEWSSDWHCKCCPSDSSYSSYGCGSWTS